MFALSFDRAGGIAFSHLHLQNSKDPAKPRNNLTIAATYEEKENQMMKIEFLSELITEANSYHNNKYLEIKIPNRGELSSRNHEAPPATTKVFKPVTPFKLKPFEMIRVSKLLQLNERHRYKNSKDLESWHGQVKHFETESAAALKVGCSICCKFFNNKVSVSEHILLELAYFNLPDEQLLQSKLDGVLQIGRKNNFNKLLLNELSEQEKIKEALKISKRKKRVSEKEKQRNQEDTSNYLRSPYQDFVLSQKCSQCAEFVSNKKLLGHQLTFSKPLTAAQYFGPGVTKLLKVEFQIMGDGKELEFLTGVTGGACPGCEIDHWDPNKTRGKPHSIQPTSYFFFESLIFLFPSYFSLILYSLNSV